MAKVVFTRVPVIVEEVTVDYVYICKRCKDEVTYSDIEDHTRTHNGTNALIKLS